jgi:hypothetical protein
MMRSNMESVRQQTSPSSLRSAAAVRYERIGAFESIRHAVGRQLERIGVRMAGLEDVSVAEDQAAVLHAA